MKLTTAFTVTALLACSAYVQAASTESAQPAASTSTPPAAATGSSPSSVPSHTATSASASASASVTTSGAAPSATSAPATGGSSNAKTAFLETQTNTALKAALSSEYAAFTSLIGQHPEYSSVLYPAQEAFTKDLNSDNALAHMSTYVNVMLSVAGYQVGGAAPTNAPAPAAAVKPNSAGGIKPAVALVAVAAAVFAALFLIQ
ncbi:hypothetical protein GQ54DRAFT_298051 [Martensiomyces pterosporus]|nr:hypothetical protein GQ54DRAFT_298051 [Martensiomyces pterosporus]